MSSKGSRMSSGRNPVRVLIVDDHALMRDGLESMLRLEPEYEVVGIAGDAKAAIQAAADTRPDIILMDLTMPGTSGIDAIVRIKHRYPSIKIIALTFHKEDRYVHSALEAGADAYVLKDDSRNELLAALSLVREGKSFLSPAILGGVVAGYLSGRSSSGSAPSWEGLTRREREVIKLVAEGKRTKDIAEDLSLSPKTVEKYRSSLMKKLGLRSISAVTAYAIQNGLISE